MGNLPRTIAPSQLREFKRDRKEAFPQSNLQSESVAPPTAELSMLQNLALMGDLKAIVQRCEQLERQSREFTAFTTHLRQLAKSFK